MRKSSSRAKAASKGPDAQLVAPSSKAVSDRGVENAGQQQSAAAKSPAVSSTVSAPSGAPGGAQPLLGVEACFSLGDAVAILELSQTFTALGGKMLRIEDLENSSRASRRASIPRSVGCLPFCLLPCSHPLSCSTQGPGTASRLHRSGL